MFFFKYIFIEKKNNLKLNTKCILTLLRLSSSLSEFSFTGVSNPHLVVNNMLNVGDVQSSCSNISGQQNTTAKQIAQLK